MFGAIAGGIASALAGGAMSKLFGGGQKAASGGIQGDVLATDNNTVGMGDAGIKSAIQGSNVPNFCKLLMLICILTKNVITSCSVTMMLFLHLEVKPLMTLTTVLYLSCALISGHLAMMLMELTKRR